MFRVSRHASLARRGTWRKYVAISTIGGTGVAIGALCAAHWEAGPKLSGSMLRAIPLNGIGIAAHYAAKLPIPKIARSALYKSYCSAIGCELSESMKLAQFHSLADFFARPHQPGTRPVHQNAAIVVPCDGKIVATGPVGPYGSIEVKGVRYRIRDLVGATEREPLAVSSVAVAGRAESGSRLWFTAIHIRPGDCHRFSSPATWTLSERRHVSGYMLWMRPTIEGLYTQNERVAFLGRWAHGLFSLTAVGAAGRGSICLDFEARKEEWFTPNLYPKVDKVSRRKYANGRDLKPGQSIGGFLLGSAVVLVFEAPESGFRFTVKPGDYVKVGEQLAVVGLSEKYNVRSRSANPSEVGKKAGSRNSFRRAW